MPKKTTDEFQLDKKNYYAFMVVPPSGKTTFQLRIPKKTVLWVLIISLFGVLLSFGGIAYGSRKTLNVKEYATLKSTTKAQTEEFERYDERIKAIQTTLKDLLDREEEMNRTMGRKRNTPKSRSSKKSAGRVFQREFSEIAKKDLSGNQKINEELSFLQQQVLATESSLRKLNYTLNQYLERLKKTPSIWPIYGSVRSRYGWRTHPVSGRVLFHKGIDIPAWIGAPVQSTADGVVEFAGWGGGYGWLVIVVHDYGYRSLYAHLSEILVSPGRDVQKGQVIGKVGDTGITTGPHVHYEIRRWHRSVEPTDYLDLDLFTALAKLW